MTAIANGIPSPEPGAEALGASDARRCIRDMLGVLALSLVWRSRDPRGILASLLEALESCLPIVVAGGRIPVAGGRCIELVRVAGRVVTGDDRQWAALLDDVSWGPAAIVDTPLGLLRATCLPFGYHGARGRLIVASRAPGFPAEAHSVLLRTAASLADAAIENATLLEELCDERGLLESRVADRTRQLTDSITERKRAEDERGRLLLRLVDSQENERRSIARDLHDSLGQQMTALRLGLATLAAGSDGLQQVWIGELEAMAHTLDGDIDVLARGLRPAALDDIGLASALASFTEQWSRQCGVACRFHASGFEQRLRPEVETNIFRIVQEALNNTAKHARAQRVAVVLECRGDEITLVIEDDGVGFEDSGAGDGVGLVGMRERSAVLGGVLQVESATGAGTSVFLRCPVTPPEPEAW